jgi:UrcA family protein
MPAKTFLSSFAVLSALALTAPAHAASPMASDPDVSTVKVSLSDLDLRTEAGASAGLHRIEMASRTVCGAEPSIQQIERRNLYSACVASTVDRAVSFLASPRVTALHAGAGHSIALVSR